MRLSQTRRDSRTDTPNLSSDLHVNGMVFCTHENTHTLNTHTHTHTKRRRDREHYSIAQIKSNLL